MAVGTSKADLEARVDYLRSPSVVKSIEEQGALDHVVARLIQDLQKAGADIPAHIMNLRSPTVIKALATVDLLKSAGGGRRGMAEKESMAQKAPDEDQGKGAPAGGRMASGSKSGDLRPDKSAGSGGQTAGSAVGDDGWEEFFKDPSEVVRAKKMTEPFTVKTLENRGGEVMHGKAGDYLVEGLRGDQWVVDGKIFDETYRNVDEWKQVKKTANPQKEAAKFDGKAPADNQVGPAQPETEQATGEGQMMTHDDLKQKPGAQSGKGAAGAIRTQDGPGRVPVNGGKGGIDPKTLPKDGTGKGVNRHSSAQQGAQGRRLATYDKVKGFGLYENPSGDEIFAAVEDWEESGEYPVHFGKALVDLVDDRASGSLDHYEQAHHFIGLKSGGEWAGFVFCRMHPDQNYSGMVVEYLETAPSHRGVESVQPGAGSRLLAAVFEKAEGQKVVINAMTETAPYFQKVGAKHMGGTRFVFDQQAQENFLRALEADASRRPSDADYKRDPWGSAGKDIGALKKSQQGASGGYEARKAAKQAKGQTQQGALNAQTIYKAEQALPHGLLIGPVHEAAGARVQRYYNPTTGENGIQKSLFIIHPSQLGKQRRV
jgi:hypothetical protein